MKKLILLSASVFLVACGNSNNTATPTNTQTTTTTKAVELKTFNFDNGGFAVKAPSKWAKITQSEETNLELTGYSQKAYLGYKVISKSDSIAKDLDSAARLSFEASSTEMGYTEELDIQSATVSNMPAQSTHFKFTYEGVELDVILYLLENQNDFIFTVITVESDTYPKIEAEIKDIINSLHKS